MDNPSESIDEDQELLALLLHHSISPTNGMLQSEVLVSTYLTTRHASYHNLIIALAHDLTSDLQNQTA